MNESRHISVTHQIPANRGHGRPKSMSHVTHVTQEWVTSHIGYISLTTCNRHVTHKWVTSRHTSHMHLTHEWVTSHISYISLPTNRGHSRPTVYESCHTCRTEMSHVAYLLRIGYISVTHRLPANRRHGRSTVYQSCHTCHIKKRSRRISVTYRLHLGYLLIEDMVGPRCISHVTHVTQKWVA